MERNSRRLWMFIVVYGVAAGFLDLAVAPTISKLFRCVGEPWGIERPRNLEYEKFLTENLNNQRGSIKQVWAGQGYRVIEGKTLQIKKLGTKWADEEVLLSIGHGSQLNSSPDVALFSLLSREMKSLDMFRTIRFLVLEEGGEFALPGVTTAAHLHLKLLDVDAVGKKSFLDWPLSWLYSRSSGPLFVRGGWDSRGFVDVFSSNFQKVSTLPLACGKFPKFLPIVRDAIGLHTQSKVPTITVSDWAMAKSVSPKRLAQIAQALIPVIQRVGDDASSK